MDGILSNGYFNKLTIVDPNEKLLKVVEKPTIPTYDKNERDKNLMNKEATDLLFFMVLNFQVITKTNV